MTFAQNQKSLDIGPITLELVKNASIDDLNFCNCQ